MRCAVAGCKIDNQHKSFKKDFMFFRFPNDKIVQKQWVKVCKLSDNFNIANSRICSKHFSDESYERNLKYELLGYYPNNRKRLRKDAVPCLFLPQNVLSEELYSSILQSKVEIKEEQINHTFIEGAESIKFEEVLINNDHWVTLQEEKNNTVLEYSDSIPFEEVNIKHENWAPAHEEESGRFMEDSDSIKLEEVHIKHEDGASSNYIDLQENENLDTQSCDSRITKEDSLNCFQYFHDGLHIGDFKNHAIAYTDQEKYSRGQHKNYVDSVVNQCDEDDVNKHTKRQKVEVVTNDHYHNQTSQKIECSDQFNQEASTIESKKVVKYKCRQCDFETIYKKNVERHFRMKHFTYNNGQTHSVGQDDWFDLVQHKVPEEVHQVYCSKCDFRKMRKYDLKIELLTHKNSSCNHDESKIEKVKHKCQQCNYQTDKKYDLSRHFIVRHLAKKDRWRK